MYFQRSLAGWGNHEAFLFLCRVNPRVYSFFHKSDTKIQKRFDICKFSLYFQSFALFRQLCLTIFRSHIEPEYNIFQTNKKIRTNYHILSNEPKNLHINIHFCRTKQYYAESRHPIGLPAIRIIRTMLLSHFLPLHIVHHSAAFNNQLSIADNLTCAGCISGSVLPFVRDCVPVFAASMVESPALLNSAPALA